MGKLLYVGNLPPATTPTSLTACFAQDGRKVDGVSIVKNRHQEPRGFGFVDMGSDEDARAAIAALDGSSLEGRSLRVSEATLPRSRFGGTVGGGAPSPRDPSR